MLFNERRSSMLDWPLDTDFQRQKKLEARLGLPWDYVEPRGYFFFHSLSLALSCSLSLSLSLTHTRTHPLSLSLDPRGYPCTPNPI